MKKITFILFFFTSLSSFAQDSQNQQNTTSPSSNSEPFSYVEQMPTYPGGESALVKYLADNIQYPQVAIESKTQGSVNVEIVINEDGSISNAKVLKGISPECDKEAIKVINNMPKWNPGKQGGKAVKVIYMIPITFKLN